MRALNRKLYRDLWHLKGQALAIALVVGSGVATYVMSQGTSISLEEIRATYYDRYRFAEVFSQVRRAPERLATRIAAIDGVKRVATRIVKDVMLDVPGMEEPAMARLVSIPEGSRPLLNDLVLRRGRLVAPGRPDEIVIGEAFAEAHGFLPGDHLSATINSQKRKLIIVGIALSPEYIYAIAPGAIAPDDARFGVMWMGRKALAAAFDLDGAFNSVTLTLLRGARSEEVIDRLDELLDSYGGVGAFDRDDQLSHAYISGELDQLAAMSGIIPPIFLLVAAFLLNVVGNRLIQTDREQIGLLKAFGYANRVIGWHYLKFILVIAGIGTLAGTVAGIWLARSVTEMYAVFFRFPFLTFTPDASIFAVAALVTLVMAVVGSLAAVRRAVRLAPAVAMVPAPPVAYRQSLFERFGLQGLIGEPTRMILRHLTRWPRRAALTVVGMGAAVAIMVMALFFYDSVEFLIDTYYHHGQRQDATVGFVELLNETAVHDIGRLPGVLRTEPYRAAAAELSLGHRSQRVAITGIDPDAQLRRILDRGLMPAAVPKTGLVLSTKLAELLDARLGDRIRVEVLEGKRPIREVSVSAIVEEFIGYPAYMDRRTLNRLLGEGTQISGVSLQIDSAFEDVLYKELKDVPAVAGVGLQTVALRTFRETMAETIDIMIGFYVIFAGLIAIGVVYNSARISLSERARELASLRVLGFTRFEVSYILLGELTVLTVIALPVGCVLGYALSWLMATMFDTKLFRIPLVVEPETFGQSVLVVIAAALISGLLVRLRLDRLDLIAVLKTRE